MRDVWVISDTHFFHSNIIKYCNRPFKDSIEMDEVIRENWNKTVKPGDIVWHLGDVYFGKAKREESPYDFLKTLNGKKRLILGNHDNALDQNLQKAFEKIVMWRMWPEFGILFSHVPIHADSFRYKCEVNIHGHCHDKIVYGEDGWADKRYRNVCVEHTNYFPVHIDSLRVK